MRLTLRTMLAYMDDILEPNDAQEIGQKIEESEFAGKLLHRIRDCIRRGILAAPGGEEIKGLDPNTVAEYLDNTLPADRVPDFEKVCLESDAHLAEVASCHQVLTLVLGEPAEVDPASRQRMYELPATVEPAATPAEPSVPSTSDGNGQPVVVAPPRPKAEVPDYLLSVRRSRRRVVRFLIAGMVLLALVGVGALALTGQLGPGSRLRQMAGLGSQVAADAPSDPAPSVASAAATQGPSDLDLPAVAADSVTGVVETVKAASEKVAEASQADAIPVEPGEAIATDVDAAGTVPPVPPAAMPGETGTTPVTPDPAMVASRPLPPGELPTPDDAVPPAEVDPTSELPPEPVGQLIDPAQVLLKFDGKETWQRVPGEVLITSADRLQSLPTYRPIVQVGNGFHVQLIDNARVRLLPTDADGTSGIAIEYGRLIIQPGKAKPESDRLRVQAGQKAGVVRLVDGQSTVAIEVGRGPANGDPETEPGAVIIDLHVTAGKALWEEASGEVVTANSPVKLTISELPAKAVAVTEFPVWIAGSTVSQLDQRASITMAAELATEKPVVLKLHELSDTHRQKEVRWLASRSLAALGDFGPMLAALDDPEQKRTWTDCVDELRWAVRRSPSLAGQVRTTMESMHGEEGAGLYEMLWGFEGNLGAQDAKRLVDYLNHTSLAFRRLGFWNLRTATGLSLYYQPEDPPIKRAPAVQKWRERTQNAPGKAPAAAPEDDEAALGDTGLPAGNLLLPIQ